MSSSTYTDFWSRINRWQRIEATARAVLDAYRIHELNLPQLNGVIDDLEWALTHGDRNR